ncbi:B3 domain-containing protein LOC_Os12g40080-like isoform X2 [Cannabis sativa]|uniref:B3 domain-containing protein LOC_Os12g40080-like isoform X2 n=1 Tax=Cannabis sativa TaxID=3483 RepID=UPI0029CA47C7|nr:B3 domain-containing protein LOC_Os12g40080-like isoform X2 [Cannabis sativa]
MNITGRFKLCAKRSDGIVGESVNQKKKQFSMTPAHKRKALSRTQNFKSKNPYFKVALQETHVQRYDMTLQEDFWKKNIGDGKCEHNVTLCVPPEKRKWHLKLHITSHGTPPRAWFDRRGWKEFIGNNHLKIEDVLIFELIEKTEQIIMFNIIIFQATKCDRNSQQLQSHQGNNIIKSGITNSNDHNSKSSSSKSDKFLGEEIKQSYPNFEVTLGESVDEMLISNVRTYFQVKPEIATLQVLKKCWKVDLRWGLSDEVILYGGGWSKFAKENRLHPGDSCLFEIVRNEIDNALFKVTITVDVSC